MATPTNRNTPRRYLNPLTQQFPVYYEDGTLLVYENGSGEIFVENKRGKNRFGRAKLRISSYGEDLNVYAAGGRFVAEQGVQLRAV